MIVSKFKHRRRIYFIGLTSIVIILLSSGTTETFNISLTDAPTALVVTKLSDTDDGVCYNDCSLREAISVVETNSKIEFATNLDGKIK